MGMTELNAQQVTLLRILEQSPVNELQWTAGDAREATREAQQLVKSQCPLDEFVTRRAQLALDAIATRSGKSLLSGCAPRGPVIIAWLIIIAAFLMGLMTDVLLGQSHMEIIHLPFVALIVWNLFIYILPLIVKLPGIDRFVAYLSEVVINKVGSWRLSEIMPSRSFRNKAWMLQFRKEWLLLSYPLIKARISLIMHAAAILFAIGAMLSLDLRGISKEYRIGWESTSIKSADSVRSIARFVLAPSELLFNKTIPDAKHIATLQRPGSQGEVAIDWIYLYSWAVLGWIIIPRFILLMWNAAQRWRLQKSYPLPLHGLYFRTMDAVRKGRGRFLVIPFRYELKPQTKKNLSSLIERIHGISAEISIPESVLMGQDPADWKPALGNSDHIAVFVVFGLSATAEPDLHGKFVRRIRTELNGIVDVIPIVDIGTYSGTDRERRRERSEQWRRVLESEKFKPVFLDLSKTDDEESVKTLERRLKEND